MIIIIITWQFSTSFVSKKNYGFKFDKQINQGQSCFMLYSKLRWQTHFLSVPKENIAMFCREFYVDIWSISFLWVMIQVFPLYWNTAKARGKCVYCTFGLGARRFSGVRLILLIFQQSIVRLYWKIKYTSLYLFSNC